MLIKCSTVASGCTRHPGRYLDTGSVNPSFPSSISFRAQAMVNGLVMEYIQ